MDSAASFSDGVMAQLEVFGYSVCSLGYLVRRIFRMQRPRLHAFSGLLNYALVIVICAYAEYALTRESCSGEAILGHTIVHMDAVKLLDCGSLLRRIC